MSTTESGPIPRVQPGVDTSRRLSVILPVRNGEPHVFGQVRGVEGTECSRPWEVVVVDTGSTDTSADRVRQRSLGARLPPLARVVLPRPSVPRPAERERTLVSASPQSGNGRGRPPRRPLAVDDCTPPRARWATPRGVAAVTSVSPVIETPRRLRPWAKGRMRVTLLASLLAGRRRAIKQGAAPGYAPIEAGDRLKSPFERHQLER